MFQIKDFVSIVASMVNFMRGTQDKVTDFRVGSVARSMLEAPAIEMDELYQQMFIGLRESIPVSVFNTFGFARLPAAQASGVMAFTLVNAQATDTLIPAGTRCETSDGAAVQVLTDADMVIAAGNTTGSVLSHAVTPGVAGNLVAGAVTVLVDSIPAVLSVTNAAPFAGGRDDETDADRLSRFRGYISTLARGTVAAIRYGALQATVRDVNGQIIEQVKAVAVEEPYIADPLQPPAWVKVHVHNGVGSTSLALRSRVSEILHGYYEADGTAVPGWKAAGVKVDVLAAAEVAVNVTGTITVSSGYVSADVLDAAETAVRDYLFGLDVGTPALKAEIIALIMSVDGVYNVALSVPAGDTAATVGQKCMPGILTLGT